MTDADLKLYGKGEPRMYEDLEKDHLRLEARLDRDCRIKELEAQLEKVEEPALRIIQWCEAYPLDIFPEPDFKLARKGLESVGITMDAVSASCMRRVIDGISGYAKQLQAILENKDV